jgi:hypothetical protein
MARKARRSNTASRNASARRRDGRTQRTGVDEREGWEDFAQKREWFLSGRAIPDGRSRTQARLDAIAQAEALGIVALESLDPGGLPLRAGARLASDGRVVAPRPVSRRLPRASLLARPVEARLPRRATETTLQVAVPASALARVDQASIRMFRLEPASKTWQIIPRSGFAPAGGYAWARLHRPGIYAPVGLPLDRAELAALVRTFNARAELREAAARSRAAGVRAVASLFRRAERASGGRVTMNVAARNVAARLHERVDLPEWDLLAELEPPPRAGEGRRRRALVAPALEGLAPRVVARDWWKLGPRNFNGRIKSLAIRPNQRFVLYAGAANGGVWITVNGGVDWNALWFRQPSMAIGAIAVAPSNPLVMYAATGEDTPGWGPSYGGAGVFRTSNGGSSWAACASGPGTRSNKVLVHPTNPDVVYVATDTGLWKSVDGGASWANRRPGRATDALLDPTAPETLYVGAHNDGVYRSVDGGATWVPRQGTTSGFFTALPWGQAAEWIKLSMGLGGTRGTRFIAAKMGQDSGRVFLSTTAGDNWIMVPDVVQPAGYNEWTNMISVHPRFSNRILAGAVGLSRTVTSYTFDPTSGTHSDHHQVVYDPVDPTTCYVATDGGVYRSLDGGATWALQSRGMTATQFYSVGVSQTDPFVLGGATQDQGVLKLRPGSELDWDDVHAGNEGGFFIVDPNDSRTIYTTPWSNNLRRSTDTGATWNDIRNGMSTTFNGAPVGPATVRHLAVRFGLSSHLIAGGTIVVRDANGNEIFHQSRVYLSLTRGDAWVGRELTDGDVNRVAFSPAEPLTCFAVTSTGNVYKSSGGWTWRLAHTAANRPSPMYITGLALSWTNPDVLYITFGGYGGPRIMRSDDAGAHWTDRSGTTGDDLPAIPISSIVVSPVSDDVAYVSTDIGVFRTQDGGATWQDFNDGWQWQDVPRIIVTELALRRSSRTLFASTLGRGVYRRAL